jgi:hypothetical protein
MSSSSSGASPLSPHVAVPHLDVSLTATAAITRPLVNPSPIWEWIGEKSVRQHAGQLGRQERSELPQDHKAAVTSTSEIHPECQKPDRANDRPTLITTTALPGCS